MECKFAYLKNDVEYILCSKEPVPSRVNRAELFHAVCPHQEHCAKERCHKMTPSWLNCLKLAEKPQASLREMIESNADMDAVSVKKPSQSRRKAQK